MSTTRTPRAAKTARAPTAPPTTRKTRAAPKSPDAAEDELVDKMSKVLKVSEPTPQAGPSKPSSIISKSTSTGKTTSGTRTTSTARAASSAKSTASTKPSTTTTRTATASKATSNTAPSAKPSTGRVMASSVSTVTPKPSGSTITAAPRVKTASKEVSAPPAKPRVASSTAPSKTVANASSSTAAKTSAPAVRRASAPAVYRPEKQVSRSKLLADLPWTHPDTPRSDKARQAMVVINTAVKTLNAAITAGYKHAEGKAVDTPEGRMDEETIAEVFGRCEIAIDSLREVVKTGHLGDKAVEVNRALLGVVVKAVVLGMFRKALVLLAAEKSHLLERYQPQPASNTVTAAKPSSSSSSTTAPTEWVDLLSLPAPTPGTEMSDTVKACCCTFLISAWISILAMDPDGLETRTHFPLPLSAPPHLLHPLVLASELPALSNISNLQLLYRRFNTIQSSDRSIWLYARQMSMMTLMPTISTSAPPTRHTPGNEWEHIVKILTSFVKLDPASDEIGRQASMALGSIVEWAEMVIERRQQDRSTWLSGKGWTDLMDLWISLSRRLRDIASIERAVRLLGGSSSIEPRTPPKDRHLAPLPDTMPTTPAPSRSGKSKGKARANEGAAEITALCAEMATMKVVLEKYKDEPDELNSAAVESALNMMDLDNVLYALMSLKDADKPLELLEKVFRNVERVRQRCVSILRDRSKLKPSATLVTALRHGVGCMSDLAEDILQSPLDISTVTYDTVACALDSLLVLGQVDPPPAQSIVTLLNRGRKLILLARAHTTPSQRGDWLRSLVIAAYNHAVSAWSAERHADSLLLARLAVELSNEAIGLATAEDREKPRWVNFEAGTLKRCILLAHSLYKCAETKACVEAYFSGLGMLSPADSESIQAAAKTTSIKATFTSRLASEVIAKIAQTVGFAPDSMSGDTASMIARLDNLAPDLRGAILERVLEAIFDSMNKPVLATIALEIGDALLEVYSVEQMPVRRLRVLIALVTILSKSGIQPDRFDQYMAWAEEAAAASDLAQDVGLAKCKPEFVAALQLQQALFAYHGPESSERMLELGRKAMAELRQILIPPSDPTPVTPPRAQPARTVGGTATRARKVALKPAVTMPPKTPARKTARSVSDSTAVKASSKAGDQDIGSEQAKKPIFEEVDKIAALLCALSALLGMLGHVLAKVEALKLLRAILRREDDHVEEYVVRSSQLATEYLKLGKITRAKTVFAQAYKVAFDPTRPVYSSAKIELHLRHAAFCAMTGDLAAAEREYTSAVELSTHKDGPTAASAWERTVERLDDLRRGSLANIAIAAISLVRRDHAQMMARLTAAFRLQCRVADLSGRIAAENPALAAEEAEKDKQKDDNDDPFKMDPKPKGADEPSKDTQAHGPQSKYFKTKQLYGLQWAAAESLLEVIFAFTQALAERGTVASVEYFLKIASDVSTVVKSPIMLSRTKARFAEVQSRMRQYEKSLSQLGEAEQNLGERETKGPDEIEISRIKGDLYAKQEMTEEAGQMFDQALSTVQGLEVVFNANEALVPSPKKIRASISHALSTLAASKSAKGKGREGASGADSADVLDGKEVVLPDSIKRVLRQQAWLLREAGYTEDSEEVLAQIKAFCGQDVVEAEDLYLDGRIGLHEAFSHFKTDLWMSSLTESTLAMPMGNPGQRTRDRQSTRRSIQSILQRSEQSFVDALDLAAMSGRVEDVREACLSLALLRAFQTSLGEGSSEVTASAADILASATAITLPREVLESVDAKYRDTGADEVKWPLLNIDADDSTETKTNKIVPTTPSRRKASTKQEPQLCLSTEHDDAQPLKSYWESLKAKYSANVLLAPQDVSKLPKEWVVISINVTNDRNTMFISRHQADHEPLVFTLPLDRQGKREGEEADALTFDAGVEMLADIIKESTETARSAKTVVDQPGRDAWWAKRFELDRRLKELCHEIEFCWLGAFKTILSSRIDLKAEHLEAFRGKIELVFNRAIFGGVIDAKRANKVHLDDTLLRTFASLSSKCRDEEAEDLVYFILDIYQFCGVQVALAELDIDQLAVDVKTVLTEMEALREPQTAPVNEHIFLALDKNVSPFPWESIPILRGRAVSRVPSLPIMLDQVDLVTRLQRQMVDTNSRDPVDVAPYDGKRHLNTRSVFYICNPSGDLERTQTFFEPYLKSMTESCGWKGIIGRSPTELEMVDALTNHDLVLYIGHGGGEQYIRSYRVRNLPHCATTMLWGCSSGLLKDQGDFDRAGTAYNYVLAGCPSLVANLWDVTDADIDKVTKEVLGRLNLDVAHVPPPAPAGHRAVSSSSFSRKTAEGGLSGLTSAMGQISLTTGLSSVEAVAKAREKCKLTYLTGAAPVVYGLPMYFH